MGKTQFTKIFMKTIIWSLRHILLLTYRIKYVFTGSNVPLHDQMCRYRIKYMVTDAITISKTKMVAQVIQWSGVIGEFKKLADPVRLWSGPVRQTGSVSVIGSGPVSKNPIRSAPNSQLHVHADMVDTGLGTKQLRFNYTVHCAQ